MPANLQMKASWLLATTTLSMVTWEAPEWEGKGEPRKQGEGKHGHGHSRELVGTDQDLKRELGYCKKAADSVLILLHSLQFKRERKKPGSSK